MKLASSDISLKAVAKVLGESKYSLKELCAADSVNRWSWRKPMNADTQHFYLTDDDISASNDGLNFAERLKYGIYDSATNGGILERVVPSENFRLGDFREYDHEQGCWWNITDTNLNDTYSETFNVFYTTEDHITIKFTNGSWLGKLVSLAIAKQLEKSPAPDETHEGAFSWGFIVSKDANIYPNAETNPRLYYNVGTVTKDTSVTSYTLPIGSGTNLPSGTFSKDVWRIIPCVNNMHTSLANSKYKQWFGLDSTSGEDMIQHKFIALFPETPLRFKRINEAEQLASKMRFALNIASSGCTDYNANAVFNVEISAPSDSDVYYSAYIILNDTNGEIVHEMTVNPYTLLSAGEMLSLPSSTEQYNKHWTSTDSDRAQVSVYIVICNKLYDTYDSAATYSLSLIFDSKTSFDGKGSGTIEIKPTTT